MPSLLARPLGEEYGESEYSTEGNWFTRDFCDGPDTDSNLELERDYWFAESSVGAS